MTIKHQLCQASINFKIGILTVQLSPLDV